MQTLAWIAFLGAALTVVAIVRNNFVAWGKRRGALDPRPLPWSARWVWALSFFSGWAGPLMLLLLPASFFLAYKLKRDLEEGRAPKRAHLVARVAWQNIALWVLSFGLALSGAIALSFVPSAP